MNELEILDPELTKKLFEFAHDAHTNHNVEEQTIRMGLYPYIIHPFWAASTLIMDPDIPKEERILGFQILVLHDVLEDTSCELPDWVSKEVRAGVQSLTHETWEEESEAIQSYTPFLTLLKLCDKMQTMYERGVRKPENYRRWKELVARLTKNVKDHYGKTRVVIIADALLENTNW